jgi:hypothetical protein
MVLWFPLVACYATDATVLSVVDVLLVCVSAVAAAHSDVNILSAIGVPKKFGVPAIAGFHAVVSRNFIITKPLSSTCISLAHTHSACEYIF